MAKTAFTYKLPYAKGNGSYKRTDHKIGNPLNNVQSTCGQCHGTKAETMAAIVKERKQRADTLRVNSMNNLAATHLDK